MPTIPKCMSRSAVGTSPTAVYVPADTKWVITGIHAANITGVPVSLTVGIGANRLLDTVSVAASDSYSFDTRQVLEAGENVNFVATATGLHLHINGVEIT